MAVEMYKTNYYYTQKEINYSLVGNRAADRVVVESIFWTKKKGMCTTNRKTFRLKNYCCLNVRYE